MDEPKIKKPDLKRFNAFVNYSRSPFAAYLVRELEWFSNDKVSPPTRSIQPHSPCSEVLPKA